MNERIVNNLAVDLNRRLQGTVVERLLSDFGQRVYFPKGVAAQTAEALQRAKRINATVGMVSINGKTATLPSLMNHIKDFSPDQIVKYAPVAGVAALRQRWKQHILKTNSLLKVPNNISQPVVVSGLTNGISLCADMFVGYDTTIIVPDLYWGNYNLIFKERRQASVATFPIFNDEGRFNISGLKEVMRRNASSGRVVLVFNFPNNPTGYSPTNSEIADIVEATKEIAEQGASVLAIVDDAYFGLWYEKDVYRQSIFAPLATAHPNILALKVDAATKEYYAWGLRVGFITAGSAGLLPDHYAALETKFMGAIRCSVSNCSMLSQHMLVELLNNGDYLTERQALYRKMEKRYRLVKDIVATRTKSRLSPMPFNSGYFMCMTTGDLNAEALRMSLLDDGYGVIAGQDRYIRVAYSMVDLEMLPELYEKIYERADLLRSKS